MIKKMGWLLCGLGLIWGCAEGGGAPSPENNPEINNEDVCLDNDGDGFFGRTALCPNGTDCNDNDPSINPGATEVPGNGIDENCDGRDGALSVECDDKDGDGFRDIACGGTDCNDNDPDINPRATEICGNGIDENCDGMDRECTAGCIDMDGDGYGIAGSVGCPGGNAIDCDDTDPNIHPGATEVCNQKDDNCSGVVDDCALDGQICVDGSCQGGAGAQCENNNECAGTSLTCDFTANPKVCKASEGGSCTTVADCVNGLACQENRCTGNFCAVNNCSGAYPHCNQAAGHCSECPFWDVATADAACGGFEQCAPGGWCAENFEIENADPIPGTNVTEDLFWASIALAECWIEKKPLGKKDMCFAMWIYNAVGRPITESLVENAYKNGGLDGLLYDDEDAALRDIWGIGFFNLREIDWNQNLVPGTAKEVCIWYQPGGFFGGERVVVDLCVNYSP